MANFARKSISELAPEIYWQHFPHGAGLGVRGVGRTMTEAFEQAAIALMAITADVHKIAPRERVEIAIAAPDARVLFVDWLNTLLYQIAVRNMLFSHFSVRIHDGHLQARLQGESLSTLRHQPAVEIRAATFTELQVTPLRHDLWIAQCVVAV